MARGDDRMGRCDAADPNDQRACDGRPDLLLVRDKNGTQLTGCMLHTIQLLADVHPSWVYALNGTVEDAQKAAELSRGRQAGNYS